MRIITLLSEARTLLQSLGVWLSDKAIPEHARDSELRPQRRGLDRAAGTGFGSILTGGLSELLSRDAAQGSLDISDIILPKMLTYLYPGLYWSPSRS